jgi:hypothetical protein
MMLNSPLIELRWVPECPNVERVRRELLAVLADLDLAVDVKEQVGDYPSPTVLVDGLDVVTNEAPRLGPSCRLDLPTHAQLIDALRPPAPR